MPRPDLSAAVPSLVCLLEGCVPCPCPVAQPVATAESQQPSIAGAGGPAWPAQPEGPTPCPPIGRAALTDFTDAGDPSTSLIFGDGQTLSGGVFVYPSGDRKDAVRSDLSQDDWHLTGSIGDYSGFGLFWSGCHRVDASSFRGISFSVRGQVARHGSIILTVSTAAHEIAPEWLAARGGGPPSPSFGRCIPVDHQFDGSCMAPMLEIPVTAEARVHEVYWEQLAGGKPDAGFNPAEITNLFWTFPVPDGVKTASVEAYDVDLRVDDVAFIPR